VVTAAGGGDVPCMHLSSMLKHKCSSFDSGVQHWRALAERIDPRLPLDQQTYVACQHLISWPSKMWEPATVMLHHVCLCVCHMQTSPKLSEIDVWLLGNLNRNLGVLIQNLPPDSRSEVRFCHFGCFRVAFPINCTVKTGNRGGPVIVTSQTDDTWLLLGVLDR